LVKHYPEINSGFSHLKSTPGMYKSLFFTANCSPVVKKKNWKPLKIFVILIKRIPVSFILLKLCTMKNNSTHDLNSRLTGYISAAGALLALGSAAHGQVEYSGPQNIEIDMGNIEYIDINDDGVDDFIFILYGIATSYTASIYHISYVYGWGMVANARSDTYNSWMIHQDEVFTSRTLAHGLDSNAPVNASQTQWSNDNGMGWPGVLEYGFYLNVTAPGYTYKTSYKMGGFNGEDKYLGVRFMIGARQHYGWVRVNIPLSLTPITIVDWAYNTDADEGVLTGFLTPVFNNDVFYETLTPKIGISFDQPVENIGPEDFMVTGGSATGVFVVTPGEEYTVQINAAEEGIVTVELPAGAVQSNTMVVGSAATEFVVHNIETGITDDLSDAGIELYPNPVDDILNLTLKSEANIAIINTTGSVVYSKDHVLNGPLNIGHLAPGVYTIRIYTDEKQFVSRKFVKN
jgi:hypothetical protein